MSRIIDSLHVPFMYNDFQARATHICLDCGFIYTLSKPFDEQVSKLNICQCLMIHFDFDGLIVNTNFK